MIGRFVIAIIRIYQVTLSRIIGRRCRFYPSCSQYMIDAIRKKGLPKGFVMGMIRLFKCHPFHPGGYDPVR